MQAIYFIYISMIQLENKVRNKVPVTRSVISHDNRVHFMSINLNIEIITWLILTCYVFSIECWIMSLMSFQGGKRKTTISKD